MDWASCRTPSGQVASHGRMCLPRQMQVINELTIGCLIIPDLGQLEDGPMSCHAYISYLQPSFRLIFLLSLAGE